MQRDHGLSGSGSAGDHREALVRRADRLVLLGLDGGDDVAHGVASGPGQRRHQRALADHHQLRVGLLAVQQVVLDADHPVAAAAQHPAADDLHRVGWEWRGRTARRPVRASRSPGARSRHHGRRSGRRSGPRRRCGPAGRRPDLRARRRARPAAWRPGRRRRRARRVRCRPPRVRRSCGRTGRATVRPGPPAGRSGSPRRAGVHEINMCLLDGKLALDVAAGGCSTKPRDPSRSARVSRRMILTEGKEHLSIRRFPPPGKSCDRLCVLAQQFVAAVRGQGGGEDLLGRTGPAGEKGPARNSPGTSLVTGGRRVQPRKPGPTRPYAALGSVRLKSCTVHSVCRPPAGELTTGIPAGDRSTSSPTRSVGWSISSWLMRRGLRGGERASSRRVRRGAVAGSSADVGHGSTVRSPRRPGDRRRRRGRRWPGPIRP